MKKDIVRDRIMQSAVPVFETFGFDKTTLDDLGRAAGMNKTSLYYYFKNKDELYAEVLLSQYSHFFDAFTKRISRKNSAKSALKLYITERPAFIKKYTLLYKAMYDEKNITSVPIGKAIAKIKKNDLQLLKDILVNGIKTEELKKDADKTTRSIYISCDSFSAASLVSKDLVYFSDFLLAGLAKKNEKTGKK